MQLASQADPAAESEPIGLIPERPTLRPADVLCAVSHGQLGALDVGVTMPMPADGRNCAAERYKQAKLTKYGPYLEQLRLQGIRYVPLVWTAWARPHADVTHTLKNLASIAARRRGMVSGGDILRKTVQMVTLELQARAARMVLACVPDYEDEEEEL